MRREQSKIRLLFHHILWMFILHKVPKYYLNYLKDKDDNKCFWCRKYINSTTFVRGLSDGTLLWCYDCYFTVHRQSNTIDKDSHYLKRPGNKEFDKYIREKYA